MLGRWPLGPEYNEPQAKSATVSRGYYSGELQGGKLGSSSSNCAESAANLLSKIPSVFSRLVFLASCRDALSGQYRNPGLARECGEDSVHQTLAVLHSETFRLWLSFTRSQKMKDLHLYLARGNTSPRTMVTSVINSRTSAGLVPADVQDRDGFLRELAIVLLLISIGADDLPDRDVL